MAFMLVTEGKKKEEKKYTNNYRKAKKEGKKYKFPMA